VISIGNESVPPLWAASIRLVLASILLVALAFATGTGLPRGAALVSAAQFGALNFGLSFCLLYWGEVYVPSGITAVVYGIIPLMTALFARSFGLERLNFLKVGAALVAFTGVAAIFSGQLRAAVPPLPMFAVVIAAISASLSGVMLKRGPRQHPLGANAVACLVGLPICLAGSFVMGEPHALPTTARAWFPIVYLVVAGSVGAFVLYAWLINRWNVSRISFIAVVVPVVALALGTFLHHERLPGTSVLGAILGFAGLALGIAADRIKR
jgi:drug/metabolite transporter (DMT)-like permease